MSVEIEFGVTCPCDGEQATIAADPLPPEFITVGSAVVACPGGVATITITTDADAPRGSHSVTLVARGAGDSECSKGLTVKIVGPDIQFGTLSEEEEEAPGGLVALNDDDDDYPNCQPDLEQTQPLQHEVEHENDIKELTLTVDGYESAGTVRLEHPEGQDKIKVYRRLSPGSDTLVRMASWPKIWSPGTFTNPTSLFVEGVELSDGPRDVELELWYEPPVGDSCVDKLKLTVDKLDADVDSDNTSGAYDFPPGRTDHEDQIESDPTYPGRLVPLNDDDDDGDGIFDWDDGSDRDGVEATDDDVNTQENDFVKVVLQLPKAECAGSSIQFEFAWNEESQPAAVAVWGRPGHEARPEENDRLKPGNVYFVDDLPYYNPDTRIIQLWVEGLASGMRTALRFTWAGAGPSAGAVVSDTVFVTVVERTRLHAPYTGSIHSLRAASMDLPHGEILNAAFPKAASTKLPESQEIRVWVDTSLGEPWDRSVLRMYCGIDGSDSEIDLTEHTEYASACGVMPDSQEPWPWRFSFRAVATKTLAPRCFVVHVSYGDSCGANSRWDTYQVCVEPFTAEHLGIGGESQLFLAGVPVLDVSVGAASLTLRSGVRADQIGQAYVRRTKHDSDVYRYRVVFPDGVEQTFLPHDDQFTLGDPVYAKSGAHETPYGTPCPGHLLGFHVGGTGGDVYGPDGTHWYAPVWHAFPAPPAGHFAPGFEELAWIQYACPLDLAPDNPARVRYIYDTAPLTPRSRVVKIQDGLGHWIQLGRDPGSAAVTSITTSDGRSWAIQSDDYGRVVGIVPGSGNGARYFAYGDPENEAVRDRITQVGLSPGDGENIGDILYGFVYGGDGDLAEEWHFHDGQLRRVAQHVRDDEVRARRDYFGPGANDYRLTRFAYDGLLHSRPASVTTYDHPAGQGTPYTTSYAYNASMKVNAIQTVTLPDQSTITYAYDRPSGTPYIELGLRRKVTRAKGGSSLTTFDVDYEFFYGASPRTLFYLPRVIARRDGRGAVSQVNYDYENGGQDQDGDGLKGEIGNHLFTVTGPTITSGHSGTRVPETWYSYDPMKRVLEYVDTEYDTDAYRTVRFTYDSLLRRTSTVVDPGGENLITQYLYCDLSPTQDRITVDADGYWTRTRFDDDGRVAVVEQFLNANAGSPAAPCDDPSGPVYRTVNTYDSRGYLAAQAVENKDQAGASLVPEAIVTTFTRDRLGRLTQRTLDMEDTDQEWHVDYNWLGEIEKEYDTSGRGTSYTYNGRGFLKTTTPLIFNGNDCGDPDAHLTTTFKYDALGNLSFTYPPTHPEAGGPGPYEERVYDRFGRLEQLKKHAGTDGGNLVTTTYEYDLAGNVTRTYVTEAGVGVLSDVRAAFDEGGFVYATRQRLADEETPYDPVTWYGYDWAGNLTQEIAFGDGTVPCRVVETEFDRANRVQAVREYGDADLLAETWFERDNRGNVTEQWVRLGAGPYDWAVTGMTYDALGRTVQITQPEDIEWRRHYTVGWFDSRGNLRRQTTFREAGETDVPVQTSVFAYDNAGRTTHSVVLANPAAATSAENANPAVDRAVRMVYDADGRLVAQNTYNNNLSSPIQTVITYDPQGRVDTVTDPIGAFSDAHYLDNGRLDHRVVYDGVGNRTFRFGYDGSDRVVYHEAVGSPSIVTRSEYDGLGRIISTTDPNGIKTVTFHDRAGRPFLTIEDAGGAGSLARQTQYYYNTLSQLVQRVGRNSSPGGTPLTDQLTTYRYDALGRPLRVVYPDSTEHAAPESCTNCVRSVYDFGGRLIEETDQRGVLTTYGYEIRGLLLTKAAGGILDSFDHDALGRTTIAQRGTLANSDAVARSEVQYTSLGDIDREIQTVEESDAQTVFYGHDQAGNCSRIDYPAGTGVRLTYVPNAVNAVAQINRGPSGSETTLVEYHYDGHMLNRRRIQTTTPGNWLETEYQWDDHRRNKLVRNYRNIGRALTQVNRFARSYDAAGNPYNLAIGGPSPIGWVETVQYQYDRLHRLTAASYSAAGGNEWLRYDWLGNRQMDGEFPGYMDTRDGESIRYWETNNANEYNKVGPPGGFTVVEHDAAGNLVQDERGIRFSYNAMNSMVKVGIKPATPITDCNDNGIADAHEINSSTDVNNNDILDECEFSVELLGNRDAQAQCQELTTFDAALAEFDEPLSAAAYALTFADPVDHTEIYEDLVEYLSTHGYQGELNVTVRDGTDWNVGLAYAGIAPKRCDTVYGGQTACPEKQDVEECLDGAGLNEQIGADMLADVAAPWDFLECEPHAFSVTVVVDREKYSGTYGGMTFAELVDGLGDPFFAAAYAIAFEPASTGALTDELVLYLSLNGYEGQVSVGSSMEISYCGSGPDTQAQRLEVLNLDGDDCAHILAYGRCAAREDPSGLRDASGIPVEPSGDAQYVVDALGRRVARKIYGKDSPSEEITHFYYAAGPGSAGFGNNIIVETDAGGTAKRYYVHGTQYIDERILMHDITTGTEYYYLPEEMHTVSALADASGHVVESYRYDAYGKVTMTDAHGHPIEQSAVGNPYFFTGRWLDFYSDSAGQLKQFYDYRARTYDPENGRFLQRDPKGYVDGGNLYEAFGSNPARFRDPMGEYITTDDPSIAVWILDRIHGLMPFAFHPELTYKASGWTGLLEWLENPTSPPPTRSLFERPWKIRLSLTMDEVAFLLDDAWWPIESEDDFRWLAWLAAAEEHFEFNDRDAVKRWYRRQAIRPIEDWLSSERVWSRVSGTGRVLGGAAVFAASLAVEGGSWGFATPLAVGGAAWSGDQIGTGLAEIWTGKCKSSLGGDAIEYALGDGTVGRIATLAYDIGPDLGVAVAAPRIFGNTARVGGYTMREVRGRWWGGSAPSRPNALMPRGREYMELSHTYISDKGRIGRLVPDSIKNRAWNLRPMWGSEHALVDPARYRLMSSAWKATNPLRSAPLRLWGRMPAYHRIVLGGGLTVTVTFVGEYVYDEVNDEWTVWDP